MASAPGRDLAWLLDDLAGRLRDFRRAVILSRDGLLIAASSDLTREDAEHLSAVAAAVQSLAAGTGDRFAAGRRAADDHRARARHPLRHRGGRGQLPGGALPGRRRRGRASPTRWRCWSSGPRPHLAALPRFPDHTSSSASDPVPAGDRWRGRSSGPVVRPYAVTGGRTEPADGEVLDLIAVVVATGLPAEAAEAAAPITRAPRGSSPCASSRSPWPTSRPTPRCRWAWCAC